MPRIPAERGWGAPWPRAKGAGPRCSRCRSGRLAASRRGAPAESPEARHRRTGLRPLRVRGADPDLSCPLPDARRLSSGTDLRWASAWASRWDVIDLDAGTLRVIRTAAEVNGRVLAKPYMKSRAGRREVPLPAFVAALLVEHRSRFAPGPAGVVFTNSTGGPLRRSMFRTRVWRPALVRAGYSARSSRSRRSRRAAGAHPGRTGPGSSSSSSCGHSGRPSPTSSGTPRTGCGFMTSGTRTRPG
jgi:hypothetical protein